jgi:hypothetical protein
MPLPAKTSGSILPRESRRRGIHMRSTRRRVLGSGRTALESTPMARKPCLVERKARPVRFLTNEALVVLAIAVAPAQTVRQLSDRVGITERATYTLLRGLERDGYVVRRRVSGRPMVTLIRDKALEHPLLEGRTLEDVIGLVPARPTS